MNNMPDRITGGVDTHLDVHVAAALSSLGALLGTKSFRADASGYRELLRWLRGFGEVECVGVEGTGSYGAGLTRHLHAQGISVVEVDRPNRRERRRQGKSDVVDAIAAARATQSGEASGEPKTKENTVECLRVLRLVKLSARKDRTRALNEMRALVATAPEELREQLRDLTIRRLLEKAGSLRPAGRRDVAGVTKLALRQLARRVQSLDSEIKELDSLLTPMVAELAPTLLARFGVGPDSAAALLIAAGENPERLKNERSFARMCGVAPLDASSGKQQRHRLNRGGNRQANSALWCIVMSRLSSDPRTKQYFEQRTKDGLTKKEAMRCLKRYVAREVFLHLPSPEGA